jgi:catechol 2,3-dioxygenase-like lactoylglutathione lyase family enzyme
MIRFEHINIFVKDIEKSLTFYNAVFPKWKVRDSGKGTWAGKPQNWCHFADESTYLAFSDRADSEARDLAGRQAGLAHFAFEISSIKALTTRLEEAGFSAHQKGTDNPFRHNIYFIDPDGLEVEFVEYFSDLNSERNSTV